MTRKQMPTAVSTVDKSNVDAAYERYGKALAAYDAAYAAWEQVYNAPTYQGALRASHQAEQAWRTEYEVIETATKALDTAYEEFQDAFRAWQRAQHAA